MVRFVLGRSGSGKTEYLYNIFKEKAENGDNKLLMLVPDQSSFDTEKAFIERLGAKNASNVLVVGFSKLCRFVFQKVNYQINNVIDDGTRAVMMSLALEELSTKLELFKPTANKSLVDIMLKTQLECKKSAITGKMLSECANKVFDKTLCKKMKETALVFDTYNALISSSYIDPQDNLTHLAEILCTNNVFDGYTLAIDSFSGFTAQQQKIIRLLMIQSKVSYISLCLDFNTLDKSDAFDTTKATYNMLKNIAKKEQLEIKAPIKLKDNFRFKNEELSYLEKGVFCVDCEKYTKPLENIFVYSAKDIYDEAQYIAQNIKKLITEENYRYRDIAVISHDSEPYSAVLKTVFKKYDIPFFIDSKKSSGNNPVIRFVTSIFKILTNNFERDDIMSYLKTGLSDNTYDDITAFENYSFVWNVNTKGFKTEFTKNPSGYKDNFSQDEKNELSKAERVRQNVVVPLLKFKEDAKDKTVKEITELFYELICNIGITQKLKSLSNSLDEICSKELGNEQVRVYNAFMSVLDKLVSCAGDKKVSIKRYYELLSLQISFMQMSQIPQTYDSVTISTAQRARLKSQKAVFLVGCIDSVFPSNPKVSGIFSGAELKILVNNEIVIGDDIAKLQSLETFIVYNCIAFASEKIYISYYNTDFSGSAFEPSVIVYETQKIFPNLVVSDSIDYENDKNFMWSKLSAFDMYAKNLSKFESTPLMEYFMNDKDFGEKSKSLKRAVNKSELSIENKENCELLFGKDMNISASQIDKLNSCRFYYFCYYGLNIKERRQAKIDPMEYGTLVHYILEMFFSTYKKSEYKDMSEKDVENCIDKIIKEYVTSHFGGEEVNTNSFLYRISIIKNNMLSLLPYMIKEISQSNFDVSNCELSIGSEIPNYKVMLDEKHNIAIRGSIDRVDIMEQNGEKYIRIIDYKTGTKKFNLSDVLYGLNMQMLLYLYSIKQSGKDMFGDFIPSGILYYPASVKQITSETALSEDRIEKELAKNLKMNGLLLDNVSVILGMEKSGEGKYIPVKVKASKTDSSNSLATAEQFAKIFKKLDMTIIKMGKELYSGDISASTFCDDNHSLCKYCPYDSVCYYRKSKDRVYETLNNDDVYNEIDREISQEEEKL